MSNNDELENIDGGLPHCCDNPADKLDSKMSERKQFEKETGIRGENCESLEGLKAYWKYYALHLESKLSKVREWVKEDAFGGFDYLDCDCGDTWRSVLKELKQILEGK